jgi:uncharacterized protein (DUF1684 family)
MDDIRDYREARERRLRSPEGWLALVERVVLDDGDNALEHGVATLRNGEVSVRVDGGEHVWKRGESGPGLTVGELRYEVLRQATKVAVRVRNANSPALSKFRGIDCYEFDARYRVEAKLGGAEKIVTLVVGLGVDVDHRCPGTLSFAIDGSEMSLDPVIEEDSPGKLFLIFKDATNNRSTYGAGRMLYTALPDANGIVVVDFNRAFNPPCAITEFASCPVAPMQNRLPIEILAGEKYPLL